MQESEQGRITTELKGHVFLIGIDRPKKYNGFTPKMFQELGAAYNAYEHHADARCAVLYAEGDNFTAGLQLSEFDIGADLFEPGTVDPLGLKEPRRTKPVVCAVKGFCYTIGIELMLASDIVIAEEGTRFGQVEVKRGLMAYGGATIRFVEWAGWGNAMRWLVTGEDFGPEEALRLGFVQEVVAPGAGVARATELAENIAQQAPLAVQATLRNSMTYALQGQDAAVGQFPEINRLLGASEDFAEGVQSFKDRRDGDYKGR